MNDVNFYSSCYYGEKPRFCFTSADPNVEEDDDVEAMAEPLLDERFLRVAESDYEFDGTAAEGHLYLIGKGMSYLGPVDDDAFDTRLLVEGVLPFSFEDNATGP